MSSKQPGGCLWWWSLPEAGVVCEDAAASLHFSRGQTSTGESDFAVQGAHCCWALDPYPFVFSPLGLEGKDASAQPAAEAPAQWVPGAEGISLKAGAASPRLVYLLWPSRQRQGTAVLKTTI